MSDRQVSVSRVIPAEPSAIFAIVADAAKHALIDGSGSVKSARDGDSVPLTLGSKFGMDMKIALPYRITNEVVEFETDRLIAWRHFGGHRWRYELEPVEGGTEVTETFDWSTARVPKFIELAGYPKKHPPAMERTLERLERVVTATELATDDVPAGDVPAGDGPADAGDDTEQAPGPFGDDQPDEPRPGDTV